MNLQSFMKLLVFQLFQIQLKRVFMVTRHWYFIKLNDPQFSEVYRVTCWQNIAKLKNRKEVLNTIFL